MPLDGPPTISRPDTITPTPNPRQAEEVSAGNSESTRPAGLEILGVVNHVEVLEVEDFNVDNPLRGHELTVTV